MSVKIVSYKLRETFEGKKFYALQLQGDAEIIESKSGNQYLTVKKASMPSTLDEESCKALLGTELPGTIERVGCEEYEYTTSSGEIISLNFRYEYRAKPAEVNFAKFYEPSENGKMATV
ncbi:hypothetical protein [Niabella hirudinis]|uniref:hypothetical protein n=1 Tax=Niabella hirudinis TaxID=1285929 RepID=UPI003EBC0782